MILHKPFVLSEKQNRLDKLNMVIGVFFSAAADGCPLIFKNMNSISVRTNPFDETADAEIK